MSMKTWVNLIGCHFLFRVHYTGLENLKSYNRCVICPNHSSIFDPFFIYPVSNELYIMAKSELFQHKLLARIFKRYHVFPINRNKKDPGSLLYALEIFKDKKENQLLMFPEGGVLKSEAEIGKRIRNGAVYIASKSNVPIIPVYITRRPKLFSKVEVTFGSPIFYDSSVEKDKEQVKEKSKELIDIIYRLKQQ